MSSDCKRCGSGHEYSKEDLDRYFEDRMGMYPADLVASQENMHAAGYEYYTMLIPKDFDKRFSLWTSVLAQMCFRFPSRWKENGSGSLIAMIQALAQSLAYLANSTSYKEKKFQTFDHKEIERKLGRT